MRTASSAFNHVSKPIAVAEFLDAVQATCPARFPMARATKSQRLVLAISGGVDSMAMAYLVSRLLRMFQGVRVGDFPAYGAIGMVIDHQLRDGSANEAAWVARELRRMDIKAAVSPITWRDERGRGLDPRRLPNLEGLARTYRYRLLGKGCSYLGSSSIFFAHHRDDQYETVLMRLLAGHGYRGLQGIRSANSIPECYDLHGVYKSGLLDDQLKPNPALSFRPALRDMRRLRNIFRDELLEQGGLEHDSRRQPLDLVNRYPEVPIADRASVPFLKPLNTEDGGVMIYRPLLGFDKARLMATCEANNISWVEDATNKDPTLTTRNAIRHLVRNHELPKALQKPAILGVADRSRRRTNMEEAEAHRFLVREAVIKDFDPNAGTLIIQIPPASRATGGRHKRRSIRSESELRRERRKRIMAVAVRKLIDFVTPELHLPPITNLDTAVRRLFPDLAPELSPEPPRTFTMAGVLFDPLAASGPGPQKWFLSRTPYTSTQPLPQERLTTNFDPALRHGKKSEPHPGHMMPASTPLPHNFGWRKAKLFDGRFWVRVGYAHGNAASAFEVRPFRPEQAWGFRRALSARRRRRLELLLKHYAPGKVRYTLPALFGVERRRDPESGARVTVSATMLALPTLGIHLPGLERFVRYEAHYKKVDKVLLGHRARGDRGQGPPSVLKRRGLAAEKGRRWRRERRRKMREEDSEVMSLEIEDSSAHYV